MAKSLTYLVASLLFAINAAPAFAQGEFTKDNITKFARRVGVHVNVGVMKPTDQDVTKGLTKGISVGLAPGKSNGWKFPFGISSYSEELNGPTGTQFASLSMRPVFAGVGYGWHFGKMSTSLQLQGGYSFNKVSRVGSASTAFASGDPVGISVDNAFIVRPRAQAEYFLTQHVTLRTTLSYIMMQPNVTVTTAAGSQSGAWKANGLNASIGLGLYPFRRQ